MSKTNTGGPAFPQERTLPCGSHEECEGLSIRDYFAAKAMHASMTADPANEATADCHARWAYEMADAMLKTREA